MKSRGIWVVVGLSSLFVAACGGGGDSDGASTDSATESATESTVAATTPPTTAAATTPPTTAAGGPATSFDQVQPAVIQIIATGTIRDPEVGTMSSAGSGSGFIISPDGTAVTNNHVVTGAATLEVYVGGDTTKSYNATVLGVSECNDLAVIKIDSNDPLPTLAWQETTPTVGEEVYAAGFPLGDPEFTLTRGIVAKAEAAGDTPWASIDYTLEHDANIQPGNSGGPLVSADGKVVAVNYASGSQTNTSQFFAINSQLAQEVVAELINGDFESLGINGSTVFDEEAGIAGVWVSGVAPGSPVDRAGVVPGDIVTALNGLPIGTDGTMKDYCDVIRTARADTPMDIEVLRFDTQEVLRGQLNGDGPIEPAFSFAEEVGEVESSEAEAAASTFSGFMPVVDDTGAITVEVPNEWADLRTAPLALEDGSSAPYIQASTDNAAFDATFDTAGLVYMKLAPVTDVPAALANFAPGEGCTTDNGLADYDDGLFVGQYQFWSGCGTVDSTYVVLLASPPDATYTAVLAAVVVTDADWEALDHAFNTFNVTG